MSGNLELCLVIGIVSVVGTLNSCISNITGEFLSLNINIKADFKEFFLFVPVDECIKINSVKIVLDNNILLNKGLVDFLFN